MNDREGTLRHPRTVAARLYGALLAVLILVACGGTATPTIPASIPVNTPAATATATHSVELTPGATERAMPSTPLPGSVSPVTITASAPSRHARRHGYDARGEGRDTRRHATYRRTGHRPSPEHDPIHGHAPPQGDNGDRQRA